MADYYVEQWERKIDQLRIERPAWTSVDIWEYPDHVSVQYSTNDALNLGYETEPAESEAVFDTIESAYLAATRILFGIKGSAELYLDGKKLNDRGTFGK